MNKIPCVSQNTDAKSLPSDVCVFGCFHMQLSTQLTADLTQVEWSGGSMFHSLPLIYAKTPFCCVETNANNALYCRRVVVFDRGRENAVFIFNTVISLTNYFIKLWIHCLLISSTTLLSHTSSIYDRPKRVCDGVFFLRGGCVFRENCWISVT